MEFNTRQRKAITSLTPHILCLASAGSGKALPNSTIIPTLAGPKRVEEIKEGDYLFDRTGKPTKVIGVYPQGKKKVYEITFGDGRKAKCCIDHLWNVHKVTWANNRYETLSLRELIDNGWYKNNSRGRKDYLYKIPTANPVLYEEKQYSIHPYVIGAFLGDGCCTDRPLTISSKDEEIVEKINTLIGGKGATKWTDNNYSWKFFCETYYSEKNHQPINYFQTKVFFKDYLKNICCYSYEKSIPEEYKYGSIEQRLELIQGLMDTDGSINRNDGRYNITFSTSSNQLKNDFIEVMGSLGYICSVREDRRENKYANGVCYEIHINISNSEKHKIFSLKRKKDIALECINKKQQRNYDCVSIRDIQKLDYKEEMTCFYVDNEEHLFLMNDFIVTHNTAVLTERIRFLITKCGVAAKDIVAITFTNLASDEMKKRLGSIADEAYIGTIHSYANQICMANGVWTMGDLTEGRFDVILEKVLKIGRKKYPRIKYLLVDECQDLDKLQCGFLSKLPAENDFYVGDDRQMIYDFRGSCSDYLKDMYENDDYEKHFLLENYRNCPNILKFAEKFIGTNETLSPNSIAIKTDNGDLIEDCSIYEALDLLQLDGNWGSWFILTRTNRELEIILETLEEKGIPCVTFKKGDMELQNLEEIMETNTVKVLTIHSSKGLEAKNVIVTGAKIYNIEERRVAYVAATRAENALYWCPSFRRGNKKGYIRGIQTFAGTQFEKASRTNKVIKF